MADDTTDPVEKRVGEDLRAVDQTVAIAESCTGGLVGSKITDVPGSSDYFDRSLVTYSYEAKRELLAVSRESLDAHGAVSEPVAAEMAQGVRDTARTDWGVATTGVAGPSGGSPETPVGTVYIAVAEAAPWGTNESGVTVSRYQFDGDRREVKAAIATRALRDLETALQE
ncbi:CinA family protein [Haloarcula sp. 1CSR25-25]|uniref:CinA family protein n=1 Tax=Haloarcula sp. 1CSR25-25 TaxID=2862545 RepID=UPI0028941D3E|nr:CinA family protein [Haloarcula sp. 1CSR25-25]MDT3435170.1 CinA family protein [Haloarcula sp. 1CSR25-25]